MWGLKEGRKEKKKSLKSEKVMFFFTIYLLHTGQRKHLEIFIFLKKKHRDAKVKPKKRLLMGKSVY